MKWVRRLVGLLILAVIVAGGYLAFRPQPLAVDLAEVIRGDLEVSVEEDGKTKIREKYVVATPVGGRLERIKLREGDAVLGNQTVLASIRPQRTGFIGCAFHGGDPGQSFGCSSLG